MVKYDWRQLAGKAVAGAHALVVAGLSIGVHDVKRLAWLGACGLVVGALFDMHSFKGAQKLAAILTQKPGT